MVSSPRLPVLWLCGGSGTGKSTVAWRVFNDLAGQGVRVGYVDVDQIGMLFPACDEDPDRHDFKVDNFAGLTANYRAAGAQVLLVSGAIDPERGGDFAERAVHAEIVFCLLTADEPTLRRRLVERGWPAETAGDSIGLSNALRKAPFVTTIIDCTDRTPESLARQAATLITPVSSRATAQHLPASGAGEITVVTGPRAVGKSSVSWTMAQRRWNRGARTAYVDLEQVGFLRPNPTDLSLAAANLADHVIDTTHCSIEEVVERTP
jgi:hypothetical protein